FARARLSVAPQGLRGRGVDTAPNARVGSLPPPASIDTTRSAPAMPLGRAPPARDLVSRPKGAVPWRLPAWQRRAALALTIGVMLVDVWHVSAPMVNVSTPS